MVTMKPATFWAICGTPQRASSAGRSGHEMKPTPVGPAVVGPDGKTIDQATAFNRLSPEDRQTMRMTPGAAAKYQDEFITQQQAKRGPADYGPTATGNAGSGAQPKGATRRWNPATGQLEEIN